MSIVTLRARLRDRPGSLERAIGLLRRRAFAVERLSVAHAHDVIELVVRVDGAATPPARVRAELLNLHDVIAVDGTDALPAPPTREMLLAWVRPGTAPPGNGRVLSSTSTGVLIEVTGSPDEIDHVLSTLDDLAETIDVVRSGEVAMPAPPRTDTAHTRQHP